MLHLVLLEQELDMIFSLPLSQIALAQLEEIQLTLDNRDLNDSLGDIWSYSWGSAKYSSKKAYTILIGSNSVSPLFKWLCGSCNLGSHKFCFWLLLRDRLNTRNLLRRKNMTLSDYNCVLCNSGCGETSFQIFFECAFSKDCGLPY